MNKRYDLLDEIKDYLHKGKDLKSISLFGLSRDYLKNLIDKLQNYYIIGDIETGNIHGKVFETLYISKKNLKYDEIALKFNIHIFTLDRYRAKYNKLALILINTNIIQPNKNCEIGFETDKLN